MKTSASIAGVLALSFATAGAFIAPQSNSFVAKKSLPSSSSVFDASNVGGRSNRLGSTSMREFHSLHLNDYHTSHF